MTAASASAAETRPQPRRVRIATLRNATLWLFVACGATAIIEPSPYEFMFFVVLAAYVRGGLTFEPTMAPLVLWLALWNAGGLHGAHPLHRRPKGRHVRWRLDLYGDDVDCVRRA